MRRAPVILLIAIVLLIAACGGSPATPRRPTITPIGTTVPTPTPRPTPLATATAAPTQRASTLTVAPTRSPTPAAVAQPTATRRAAGFACPGGCTTQPDPSCAIKGNINDEKQKIYHVPGGGSYTVTKINITEGDRWFCTEDEARAAGFRRAQN